MQTIVELTEALIRFQTVHTNLAQIQLCADFIENYLQQAGIHYRRAQHGDYPYILALPAENKAPVLLMSHIDVVAGDPALFDPRVENGRLYGRGSIDDKYAVALSLVMLKAFVEDLRSRGHGQADLPFGILITADEEIGGRLGACEALKQLRTDFGIVLDGGNPQMIVTREKGILHLRLIAKGKTAHGARPWLGENAIEKLIQDYLKIKPYFDVTAPDHWHRSLNFSRIQAGQSPNQVPDRAEAFFDIRYTENDDVDRLVAQMQQAIDGELTVVMKDPLFIGGPSPYLDLLLEVCPEACLGSEHGASDARFLSDHGIAGIVWGAEGEMSHHTANEYLVIDSLTVLYRQLTRFMRRVQAKMGSDD